jgi:uncharacterized protein YndB with AHSA1/START domain
MSIAPIVHTVRVKLPPARAFELFASRVSDWWPRDKFIGKALFTAVVMEPKAGGQWFERDAEGNQTHWGKVLAWEPPARLLLAWQINSQWRYDPELLTEVELTFDPTEGGGTLVRVEHRDLERFGVDAAQHAARLDRGWPAVIGAYVHYCEQHS